jgi:3-mercaptopyruvate sulfurtransferase SseA
LPDRTVVVYCFIGMRASMAFFVSRLLGYGRRLYHGSRLDGSVLDLPVQTGVCGV